MLGIVIDCETTGFGIEFDLLGIALAIIDVDTCERKDTFEIYLRPETLKFSLDGIGLIGRQRFAKIMNNAIIDGKPIQNFKATLSNWLTPYLISEKEYPFIIGTGLKYELPILHKVLGDTYYNLFNGRHIDLWDVINYLQSINKIDVNKHNVYGKWNIEIKKQQTLLTDCLANIEVYKRLKECVNA